MYYIELNLNAKGVQVTGLNVKSLEWKQNVKPTNDEVNQLIADMFMPELVESWDVKKDYRDLKPGDIVKVIEPGPNGLEKIEYGEVLYSVDEGGVHEFVVKLRDLEHFNIYRYHKDIRFYFNGLEIGGSRKYKRYIALPSENDIIKYNNAKNKNENYDYVNHMLHLHQDWEDHDDNDVPAFITVNDIMKIKDILDAAYNKYYNV